MSKVPADVYATAKHVWLVGEATNKELDQLTVWASRRWPVWIPKDAETLALWVLSISYQDGVEG